MNNQVDYFIQIFKTLGIPLTSAVLGRSGAQGTLDPTQTTQQIAELLTKSVQSGIDLGSIIQLASQGEKAESARLSLTAIAGQIHSHTFEKTGAALKPEEMQVITNGLKTAMEFSKSFEASKESELRSSAIQSVKNTDQLQSQLQILNSFAPVVQAIASNPIGTDSAEKQIQNALNRINNTAKELSAATDLGSSTLTADTVARSFTNNLTALYAACHTAEASKPAPSEDALWSHFDLQVRILESLAQSIVPGFTSKNVRPETTPTQAPQQATAPIPSTPAPPPTTPDQPTQPPAAQNNAGANPMGFFSAKPAEETPPPPATPPVQPPPVAQQPPATPPTETTPPAQPATPPTQDSTSANPANPMGFFASKPTGDTPLQSPAAPPVQPPPVTQPPPAAPPPTPPAETPNAPPETSPITPPAGTSEQAASNPMSFFTKKNDDDAE